ncbi:hypothetical protein CB0101_10015 [Synechococcus sp. CB0101]|uniref:hypothetical protein n=1 Tax=Synechococcus sp. CB0101 TaxID=232348 RepID=UPI0010AB2F03|nr:hypothetical protein [Synechococcus sp. CB0101]QCH15221.1 hypothetical protein CB0101_10015 [Synechococcus sp. CB0101]
MDLQSAIKAIDTHIKEANHQEALSAITRTANECHSKAIEGATFKECRYSNKKYLLIDNRGETSRPINIEIWDPRHQSPAAWPQNKSGLESAESANASIYSLATSAAIFIDIYSPSSRKTPGTFFERVIRVFIGEKLGPEFAYGSFVPTSAGIKVSTDISITNQARTTGLVLAAKITTRERISQVFTQQRILDVLEPQKYTSCLVALSEMQRSGQDNAREVCTPDQWILYQMCLSQNVTHAFYGDIPSGLGRVTKGGISLLSLDGLEEHLQRFKQQAEAAQNQA